MKPRRLAISRLDRALLRSPSQTVKGSVPSNLAGVGGRRIGCKGVDILPVHEVGRTLQGVTGFQMQINQVESIGRNIARDLDLRSRAGNAILAHLHIIELMPGRLLWPA